MTRRPRLRSVRTKLALVFFAIIAAAFGLLYVIATPQLESNLEQRQLDDMHAAAQDVRPRFRALIRAENQRPEQLDESVRVLGEATDSRVTLWRVDEARQLYPQSDSRTQKDVVGKGLARRALESRRV